MKDKRRAKGAGNGANGKPGEDAERQARAPAQGGDPDVLLVTGFPAFTARRIALEALERDERTRVSLLVRPKFRAAASELVDQLPPQRRARVTLIEGDVCDMDLGLSGEEYARVTQELTEIHHLAAVYFLGTTRREAERVNVQGTREVISLAKDCKRLRSLVHYSTVAVSGSRKGVVMEDELEEGQSFRNHYEETKFQAEKLVREASRHLPTVVLRLGLVVGDSRTGEIDKFDGPYYLMVLIAESRVDVSLPLPGRGSSPLYLTPIDFVAKVALQLAGDPRAIGKTFHLTSPCPLAARHVYELVAERSHRKAPRGSIPTGLARAVLRAPGLERIARAPLAMLDALDHLVIYNCRNTMALLDGTGIRCPEFEDYVDNLIRYVKAVKADRRRAEDEVTPDPLDPAS